MHMYFSIEYTGGHIIQNTFVILIAGAVWTGVVDYSKTIHMLYLVGKDKTQSTR